jgi:hypothetical protein
MLAEAAAARATADAAAATAADTVNAALLGGVGIAAAAEMPGQEAQGEVMGLATACVASVAELKAAGDSMAEEVAGEKRGEAGSSRAAAGAER